MPGGYVAAIMIQLPLSGAGLGRTLGPISPVRHKGSLLGVSGEISFPNRRQRAVVSRTDLSSCLAFFLCKMLL